MAHSSVLTVTHPVLAWCPPSVEGGPVVLNMPRLQHMSVCLGVRLMKAAVDC